MPPRYLYVRYDFAFPIVARQADFALLRKRKAVRKHSENESQHAAADFMTAAEANGS
jgi:hypothetical protein